MEIKSFAAIALIFVFALLSQTLAQEPVNNVTTTSTTASPKPETTTNHGNTTTTTPAPKSTSTIAPTSSTVDPKTTTTTTAKPTTSTTTIAPPKTTTAAPKPKPEQPDLVEFNITQNINATEKFNCFMGKFKTEIMFNYNATEGKKLNGYLMLSNESVVNEKSSSCGVDVTTLAINIDGLTRNVLTLVFKNNTGTYALVNVTLLLDPKTISEHLPNATNLDAIDARIINGSLFNSPIDKSYLCKANISQEMQDKNTAFGVRLSMEDVQIDVFRVHTDGEKFRGVQECDADDNFSDVVPIAVGAALAALVVIVLIAYFIGRRRSRQMSYQSV